MICVARTPWVSMSDRISPIVSGVARFAVIIIRPAWALWMIELSG